MMNIHLSSKMFIFTGFHWSHGNLWTTQATSPAGHAVCSSRWRGSARAVYGVISQKKNRHIIQTCPQKPPIVTNHIVMDQNRSLPDFGESTINPMSGFLQNEGTLIAGWFIMQNPHL